MSLPRFGAVAVIVLSCLGLLVACGGDSSGPADPAGGPEGRIVVDPDPDALNAPWAVTSSGKFSVSGNGDSTLTQLEAGQYNVTWGAVSGWTAPDNDTQTLDEYIRASALRSLSILVHEEVLSRGTVIEYFAELFRGKLEKEHSHLWDALAAEAVDLHAKTLADDIQGGFETGLLWPGFMHPQEIDKAFSQSEDAVLARSREHSPGLIDSVVDEMRWWACFKPQTTPGKTSGWRETRLPAGKHNPGAAVRAEPKVGRNAPCPCGSGKKYKKCCGAH